MERYEAAHLSFCWIKLLLSAFRSAYLAVSGQRVWLGNERFEFNAY